jgi:hypothetical protein
VHQFASLPEDTFRHEEMKETIIAFSTPSFSHLRLFRTIHEGSVSDDDLEFL